MTAQRSGVGTESDAMWVPALARGLIREDVLRSMRYCDGYTRTPDMEPVPGR
jgi:hypothetical protein